MRKERHIPAVLEPISVLFWELMVEQLHSYWGLANAFDVIEDKAALHQIQNRQGQHVGSDLTWYFTIML